MKAGWPVDVFVPNMMAHIASPGLDMSSRDSARLDLIGQLKPGRTLDEARAEMRGLASQLEAAHPESLRERGRASEGPRQCGTVLLVVEGHSPGGPAKCRAVCPAARRNRDLPGRDRVCQSGGSAAGTQYDPSQGDRDAPGIGRESRLASSGNSCSKACCSPCVGASPGCCSRPGATFCWPAITAPKSMVSGTRTALTIDRAAFLLTMAVATATGIAFGLLPAVTASRTVLIPALKRDAASQGFRRSRLAAAFLVAQVSISVVLVIGAALLIHSVRTLRSDPGFDVEQVAYFRMKPRLSGYDHEKASSYFRNLQRHLESLGEVESVAFVRFPPTLSPGAVPRPVFLPGRAPSAPDDATRVSQHLVGPGFFETLTIPIVRGRAFDARDSQPGRQAVVVDQVLAARLWPDTDPIGQTLLVQARELGGADAKPYEVIGVAQYKGVRPGGAALRASLFRADWASVTGSGRMLVRVKGDARTMLQLLRQEIVAVDPNVAISEALPLSGLIENMVRRGAAGHACRRVRRGSGSAADCDWALRSARVGSRAANARDRRQDGARCSCALDSQSHPARRDGARSGRPRSWSGIGNCLEPFADALSLRDYTNRSCHVRCGHRAGGRRRSRGVRHTCLAGRTGRSDGGSALRVELPETSTHARHRKRG